MEQNTLETANLVLRGNFATITETNNQGFTWQNIDLREILGELYDTYSLFKLTLIQIEFNSLGTFTNADEGLLFLNMTGLEWQEASYDYASQSNVLSARVGITFFADGTQTAQPPYTTTGLTFRKDKPFCNIRLNWTKTTDGVSLSNKSFPTVQTFRFVITPIE
jgi:hypothetical protein